MLIKLDKKYSVEFIANFPGDISEIWHPAHPGQDDSLTGDELEKIYCKHLSAQLKIYQDLANEFEICIVRYFEEIDLLMPFDPIIQN